MNSRKAQWPEVIVKLNERHLVADMQLVTVLATIRDNCGHSTFHTAILERPDAVAILPYDEIRNEVVLVRQFRAGPYLRDGETAILEIVAGYLDPAEDADVAAARELREETALVVKRLIPITSYYPAPTLSKEKLSLWCGIVDASEAASSVTNGSERLRIERIPVGDIGNMLLDGRISNALTFGALTWLLYTRQHLCR